MKKKDATIIVLAWPDTKVVNEGKWYDTPMRWIGAIKNGYYTAGHAAFLLVNHKTSALHYFDYGRYHTPLKYGRVRDKFTDPDVAINIKAIIRHNNIENINEILLDRFNNHACHGTGRLTAALVKNVDFKKAYKKAKSMQNSEAIPYGPFEIKGTTCSRFVAQVVFSSTNNWFTKLMIRLPYTISATPRSNNKILNDCKYFFEIIEGKIFERKSKLYPLKKLFCWKHTTETNKLTLISAKTSLIS